jgi:hypothetical protein
MLRKSQDRIHAKYCRGLPMKNPCWKGIFPAITTKFHADESLDLEGMAQHLDFQIRNGVHGLVTGGLPVPAPGTWLARSCRWSVPNANLSRLS